MGDAEKLRIVHCLLSVRHLLKLRLLVRELLLNAFLTERLLLEHHDGLGEVHLTQIHLDSVREEGLHGHLWVATFHLL